mmetsp:Transcript_43335/g.114065  ORF Transcript_43335/g.114065 Transcript_43335/m.114065 type:complete len:200 (+) Transcript_43335:327-926(+)|eukprot:CAMPEP_0194503656 /NCGR_PEP_ID=MMETSP0253-20130528/28503_1 /TAXON_ID=2966 /ORGANISM="Noctiluca scintillans" /LENGTH=199 /DNA_ID=CAMNT_0039345959 /DNA_START=304 /DNA_END=903 /DNA_ORIENTATION=+
MLLPVSPFSIIDRAVAPSEDAPSVFQVSQVLTFVGPSVPPCVATNTIHVTLFPLSCKAAFACLVHPMANKIVVHEASFVPRTIGPLKDAGAMFPVHEVGTSVSRTVEILFNPLTALSIVHPLAGISATVLEGVCASAFCCSLPPFAFVHIAVRMHVSTKTMCPTIEPLTLVPGTTGPDLDAKTVPVQPLRRLCVQIFAS